MINELEKLVEYANSKGFQVNFVTDGELNDYAGMNPQAADVMGYEDIEHDELKIDGNLDLDTQVNNLRHEIIEKDLMKKGMKYYPAHVIALKLEKYDLMGDELDELDELGNYDVDKVSNDGVDIVCNGKIHKIRSGKSKAQQIYVQSPDKKQEKKQIRKRKQFFKDINNKVSKTLSLK